MRVAHVPGRGNLTAFATEVGAFALQFFDEYYDIPYPGEKLDLVALPDFAFGAMENLGCVTFRETALLVDPDSVTQAEAAQVALTIVHEIAHMWFGDLVTMKWWNGIWLNEAFATFMEHAGVDALHPEWRTWDDFAMARAAALDIDALSNTRAVEYEVRTPEDADGMFDVLTYQKGGSVVRMLEQWLGADAFRDGVRHYLDTYKLANTDTTDLWDALEHATGRPARRIMDSWIFQPGYPEVAAEPVEGGVRVTQRRFRYDRADATEQWSIPMLVRNAGRDGAPTAVLLDDDATTIPSATGEPVVLNAGGEGFYRVAYPTAWPARLVASGALTARERFVLVDDAWAAVMVGTMSAAEFLDFAETLRDETDVVVWRALMARLRSLTRLVEGPALELLRNRIGELTRPAFARLGWDAPADDGPRERQLRGALLDTLGTVADDHEVVARAAEYRDRDTTDADVVAACISITAHHGNADLFDEYLDRFRTAATPQEQLRYLYSLAVFPSEELVLRAGELATTDAVRTQNAPFLVQRALTSREFGPLVWEFVRDHWDTIERPLPPHAHRPHARRHHLARRRRVGAERARAHGRAPDPRRRTRHRPAPRTPARPPRPRRPRTRALHQRAARRSCVIRPRTLTFPVSGGRYRGGMPPAPASPAMDRFSEPVRAWFETSFAAPTAAQEQGWPAIAAGDHSLILAPTGSGKTLAAFLWAIDRLATTPEPAKADRCRVLYISPLRALAVDVEKNLRAPIAGISLAAERLGVALRTPSVGMRTGDTPGKDRQALVRTPPDILITTPESLYLMLTSRARESLRSVEYVIIDEIHAMAPTKRGAHLMLSLERLDEIAAPPTATHRPLRDATSARRDRAVLGWLRAGRGPSGHDRRRGFAQGAAARDHRPGRRHGGARPEPGAPIRRRAVRRADRPECRAEGEHLAAHPPAAGRADPRAPHDPHLLQCPSALGAAGGKPQRPGG